MMRVRLWSNMLAAAFYGVVLLFLASAASLGARAQPAPSPPPPQVQQLLQLMQDPAVRSWIDEQQKPPAAAAAVPAAEPTTSEIMMQRITGLRERLAALAAAVPRLPDEFDVESRVASDRGAYAAHPANCRRWRVRSSPVAPS